MIRKKTSSFKTKVDFQNIDRQLLIGFECSQYTNQNQKFLSMMREQTNSALDNKKYWNANNQNNLPIAKLIKYIQVALIPPSATNYIFNESTKECIIIQELLFNVLIVNLFQIKLSRE